MKLLFWKEWRELRTLPLMALACFVSLLMIAFVFDHFFEHKGPDISGSIASFAFVVVLFWYVISSTVLSQEIGSDTLQFMTVLPVKRSTLWWVKLAGAFTASMATIVLLSAAWFAVGGMAYRPEIISFFHLTSNDTSGQQALKECYVTTISIFVLVMSFACGICASPFFDRAVSATVAAIFFGIFYVSAAMDVLGLNKEHSVGRFSSSKFIELAIVFSIFALTPLFVTSYQTFVHGESLKTLRRFRVGGIAAVASCLVSYVVFTIGNAAHIW
jgi:hypothetical protein